MNMPWHVPKKFEMVNQKQRKSIILKNYNYSESGHYFVTICTKDRKLYFKNDRIREIVEKYWSVIPKHFNNTKLDAYIIMLNHIHGIIIIGTDMPWCVRTKRTEGEKLYEPNKA